MKIKTNTPDVFVAGAHTLGCAVPAIIMGLGIIWGMLAILGTDEGIPNKIFAMIFFGIFVAFFFAMGLPSVYRNQLVLNRAAGVAELRLATIGGYKRTPFDLADVTRAEVATPANRTGKPNVPPNYAHVSLVVGSGMDAGTYQVTKLALAHKDAQTLTRAINDWLDRARP